MPKCQPASHYSLNGWHGRLVELQFEAEAKDGHESKWTLRNKVEK
jgi:hypothetical protein